MKIRLSLLKYLGFERLEQLSNQVAEYQHRYNSRKALLKLEDCMLKDIGLSKQQALEEGNTPFWKGIASTTTLNYKRQPDLKKYVFKGFFVKKRKSRGVCLKA